jgi:hypothetical protein
MKSKSINRVNFSLKFVGLLIIGAFLSISLFSFTLYRYADDIWKQLGISQQNGTENIRKSFTDGYFNYYGARNVKNIVLGNRAAIAKNLLGYTKQYVGSESFKKAYEMNRQQNKPGSTEDKPARTSEQIRKDEIASAEKNLKELQVRIKTMTPDMQKAMQSTVDSYNEQLTSYKDPKNKLFDIMATNEQSQIKQNKTRYENDLKKWEQEYPADANQLVRVRIRKYLDLAATVDFSAALVQKGNKKVFANPTYEHKSNDWKMIYRAGKEVYDEARVFLENWLTD